MHPLTGTAKIMVKEKLEVFKSNHLQAYEKEYCRLSGYEVIIRQDHQNCLFNKGTYLTTNQVLARRDGKLFCNKIVMVKAGIPPSNSKETVRKVLQKIDLKWTQFQRKGILTKNDLKLRLTFARKVCRKRSMCNYEL